MTPGDEAASGGGQAAAFKGWANKVAKILGVTARKRSVAVRWEKAAKADSDIDSQLAICRTNFAK